MADLQRTSLHRPWVAKMAIFFVILVGFGTWGLYDATVKYPQRGLRYAEYCRSVYLEVAQSAGELSRDRLTVDDPAAELGRLTTRQRQGTLTGFERARLEWLVALSRIGRLDPAHTDFRDPARPDPAQELQQLRAVWNTRDRPSALSAYDIPVQWAFTGIGFAGALALAVVFIRTATRTYRWDPAEKRLILPDGASIVPADIEEFDKRKWHKFYVFLRLRPAAVGAAGRPRAPVVKLDLYRYARLESWVLEMERTAFPERAATDEPPEPPSGETDESDAELRPDEPSA